MIPARPSASRTIPEMTLESLNGRYGAEDRRKTLWSSTRGRARLRVLDQGIAGILRQWQSNLPPAFAADTDGPFVPGDVIEPHAEDIAGAKAEPRQEKENCPVTNPVRLAGITIKDRLRVSSRTTRTATTPPRARAGRHAGRHRTGPRSSSPTTTPSSCASAWSSRRAAARCSRARGEELRHAGNRRPDAPAGHARPDGHEEHPGAQRRGAPLLPREAADADDEDDLKGDDKKEAEKNNEAARLWISGLEAVNRKLGLAASIDLSATPFFLRGSGYAEGTLFPWTMSDFSLMDAIECGIVKLPRVPVADNIPGDEMPMFRNLWENIRKEMPKKGRGKAGDARSARACRRSCRPRSRRSTATTRRRSSSGRRQASACRPASSSSATTPSTSKLVYDYISGFHRENEDGTTTLRERPPGAVPQLRRARQPARRARTRC